MIGEQPQPYTKAFNDEVNYFEQINDDLDTFRHPDEPESIWWHKQDWDTYSKPDRNLYLSSDELDAVFNNVLMKLNGNTDFRRAVQLIAFGDHYGDTIVRVKKDTELPETPSMTEFLEDLGTAHPSDLDHPNDFSVGVAIETNDGLLVFQYSLEECGVRCSDCSHTSVTPGKSCNHMSSQNSYIAQYQIMTVPYDYLVGAENHHWIM